MQVLPSTTNKEIVIATLFETKDYVVEITDEHVEPAFPDSVFRGYAIINRTTRIHENTSSILPEAMRWAKQLQQMLDAQRDDINNDAGTVGSDSGIVWPTKAH